MDLLHEQIYGCIKNIDVYIQLSITECLPRTLVEAMSCTCSVIGSSSGGIPELVSPEFVFKRKNVSDFEDKLKYWLKKK